MTDTERCLALAAHDQDYAQLADWMRECRADPADHQIENIVMHLRWFNGRNPRKVLASLAECPGCSGYMLGLAAFGMRELMLRMNPTADVSAPTVGRG
jgi:hypothetical protein